jgi:hypothetical protein
LRLIDEASERTRRAGVLKPENFVRMLAPGFPPG